MDFTSAFKSELFRPFSVLLIPGFVATAPFLILAGNHNVEIASFLAHQPWAFFGCYLALITAVGLLLENLGAAIERGIDDCLERYHMPELLDNWQLYLALDTRDQIVGQRFLRTLVVRAKFVHSFMPALFLSTIGFVILHFELRRWSCLWVIAISAISLLITAALFVQSVTLSESMANVRTAILEACKVAPVSHDRAADPPKKRMFLKFVLWHLRGYRSDDLGFIDESFRTWAFKPKAV